MPCPFNGQNYSLMAYQAADLITKLRGFNLPQIAIKYKGNFRCNKYCEPSIIFNLKILILQLTVKYDKNCLSFNAIKSKKVYSLHLVTTYLLFKILNYKLLQQKIAGN
jgi:hypothetical protein